MVGARSKKVQGASVVGETLRRARQTQGLSLEHISQTLLVPTNHLRALEDGDLEVFAAEVYARGVFQKYATYLNVQSEKLQQSFLRMLCEAREVVPLKPLVPAGGFLRTMTGHWFLLLLAGLVTLSVGSYLAWHVQSFWRAPDIRVVSPTQGVVDQQHVVISGWVEPQARVLVNEEAVIVEPSGWFETTLMLRPGVNVVQLQAINSAGRSRIVQKDLLLPSS